MDQPEDVWVQVMFEYEGKMFAAHKIGAHGEITGDTTGAQLKQLIIEKQSHDMGGIPKECDLGSIVLNRYVDREIKEEIADDEALGTNEKDGDGVIPMGILMTQAEGVDASAWSQTMKPIMQSFKPINRA